MSDRQLRIAGAKSAMGAAEQIISMMPAHIRYIEGFGGTGAVIKLKRPAVDANIIIEKDSYTAAQLKKTMPPRVTVIHGNFFRYTRYLKDPAALFYLDPPYVMKTRKSGRKLYRHEFTDADHKRLCRLVSKKTVKSRIMISGYAGSLYAGLLKNWWRKSFTVGTRGGQATEVVWMNFPEPVEFHDTRFVGKSFTDRQRIKRKAARWAKKFMSMAAAERAAVKHEMEKRLWTAKEKK